MTRDVRFWHKADIRFVAHSRRSRRPMLRFQRVGRVVWFAPFNATSREALAARLGLLPFSGGVTHHVRYWHSGTSGSALHTSAIGGKADMRLCTAHVCF